MYASTAILAALQHRSVSGTGQYIDLSLFDVSLAMLANQGSNFLVKGQAPGRLGNGHPVGVTELIVGIQLHGRSNRNLLLFAAEHCALPVISGSRWAYGPRSRQRRAIQGLLSSSRGRSDE